MKKVKVRIWTLALAFLAGMSIVFFQLFYFQAAGLSKKEIKKEQKENHSDDEKAFNPLPSSNLPTSTYVALNRDVFFLFEILLEEDESVEHCTVVPLLVTKVFSTLLGSFISPNAP